MASEYDPLTNPMTYEEYRNYILLKLQAQGINPFFELDLDNLPSSNTSIKDIYNHRKVYGDVVSGFYLPGFQLDTDGDLVYADTIMDSTNSAISSSTSAINKNTQLNWLNAPGGYGPSASTPTTITSYQIDTAALTLSSGSIAATAVVAPGASKKAYCHYCMIDSSNTTNPESTYYQLNFTEETSGDYLASLTIQQTAGMGGQKIPLEFVTSTNDKDVNCAVSGGQGAETIHIRIAWGKV